MKKIFNPIDRKTVPIVNAATSYVVSDVTGTVPAQSAVEFQEKRVATLLITASETLAKLRTGHQALAKTEQEDLRRDQLCEMQKLFHSLAGSADLGFHEITQMASALESLFVELQAKPKKITSSVMRTVAQAIDTLASLFDRATKSQPEVPAPQRVLVVDDEIISRETICSALGRVNLTTVSLEESLVAQRLLEQDHFDLIFLDVEMPGQSGLQLCGKIRKMATNRLTPVVFVTTHCDFGSRAQSTLTGGNDFISKPFLAAELAVKALTWLFRKSPSQLSTTTVEASSDQSQLPAAPTALSVAEKSVFQPDAVS